MQTTLSASFAIAGSFLLASPTPGVKIVGVAAYFVFLNQKVTRPPKTTKVVDPVPILGPRPREILSDLLPQR